MRTTTRTRPSTSLAYVERINRAIDHAMDHLDEPLNLDRMARAARLSPFHFHRVFQGIVGRTPSEFVRRLRLERAMHTMIHAPRRSLTRIALDCGFSSVSDFSRSFRRCYGAAPSKFDLEAWRRRHAAELEAMAPGSSDQAHVGRLPARANPDCFRVAIREVPARTVAYIRVRDPYRPGVVPRAAQRLVEWAEARMLADGAWLGYQWDNPEIVPLKQCHYHVAVEAARFEPEGEIGRYRFPAMLLAQVEVRGNIDLELRALQWLYGSWLPRSGYVPDNQPCFEAWIGRPFAHGHDRIELRVQLPVKRE